MNDLSRKALREDHYVTCTCNPIPSLAICILITLFLLGLSVSIFILIVVHNAFFFLSVLLLSALVLSFILWNTLNWTNKAAIFAFLRSFPDSDLRVAKEGQLVKITGVASCGSVSLESSYEKAARCIYTSTTLYEYRGFSLNLHNLREPCFRWNLSYCERFSTEFYITDRKSGLRAVVKAGSGCNVIPLIIESKLVNTTKKCRNLSPSLSKWLRERNLSADARVLCLEEGYVHEGSSVTVIGTLRRNNGVVTIVQPPESISTGCVWKKCLLPVDINGLVLGVPEMAGTHMNQVSLNNQEQ